MSDLLETLQQEGVDPALLEAVQQYRTAHALPDALRPRIPSPAFTYYGKQVWEQALAALLCGENLLLAGGKATGKNVLAENLAAAFGRPAWDISFHVNMDAASLIGMDTFADGQVVFRPGPVYRCAQCGGFGVLDEINMAKNEALAVLHAVLDFRRAIDVPGYDRIPLAEETRFIATMNYGYAGTRELNEALTSRFVVIQMPTITEENLEKLLRTQFPDLNSKYVRQFALLFLDLQKKCDSAEISTKALGKGTYKYIDTMICCSVFMKTKLDTNPLFAKKTIALHNFIDKVEWKEVEKKDYVLYFGRFSEEKGIGTLINVCKKLPNIQFIFAGTGPLEEEINGISNIKNLGFQKGEALEKLIREARFSIYPSEWYENCPFSVMESQMYGTPVLGANIGGIPELISVGSTGELFESGNGEDLKNKIEELWNNKEKLDKYSENCKNISFDTIEKYCNKLIKIYE